MPGDQQVLRFRDVNMSFGSTPALDAVSFAMTSGDTRVVLGAAGSGKTTLLKTALGLLQPDSGEVDLFGEDITRMKETAMFDLRSRVGILFQEGGLFDSMTVADNVAYPLLNQHSTRRPGVAEIEERVRTALRFVELEHTLEKFPSELSGGMRRRVGIARAIVTEPQLVLYDSPTAGLDPITANTIIALLIKERDLRNTAAVMVTHRYQDGHLMANFRYNPNSGQIEAAPRHTNGGSPGANRVKTEFFVMNEGRLVFEGSQEEIRATQDSYIRKFVK
jgi:phospholipid/cholesterol/gamma-HCH transport system ATP-binding protein